MPAKELLDTPLALTADHHRAAIDAAATSLHTSQLLREAGELITAVTTLEEKAPSFVNRVQKTQLVSARPPGNLREWLERGGKIEVERLRSEGLNLLAGEPDCL